MLYVTLTFCTFWMILVCKLVTFSAFFNLWLEFDSRLFLFQAFATVFVTVLDRNDNSPRFSQASYTGNIIENSAADTTVNMVRAGIGGIFFDSYSDFETTMERIGHEHSLGFQQQQRQNIWLKNTKEMPRTINEMCQVSRLLNRPEAHKQTNKKKQ